MDTYHKIQSIYLRDPATKHKTLLEGQYTTDAFAYLAKSEWQWTEKIDGTNIRVTNDGSGNVEYGGRTDNAQIPATLVNVLSGLFRENDVFHAIKGVTLYGEGYGEKIQSGGDYIVGGCGFILFDVLIDGLWLRREDVEDIAGKLGISVVPMVGRGTLREAVDVVRNGMPSVSSEKPRKAEGLVMRPSVELLDRRGYRVITKIKTKDFA